MGNKRERQEQMYKQLLISYEIVNQSIIDGNLPSHLLVYPFK